MPKEESSSSFGIFLIAPTVKIYFYLRIKLFKFYAYIYSSNYSQTNRFIIMKT